MLNAFCLWCVKQNRHNWSDQDLDLDLDFRSATNIFLPIQCVA